MANKDLEVVCDLPEEEVTEGMFIPKENNFVIETDSGIEDQKAVDLSGLGLNDLIATLYTADPVTLDQAYNWVKNGIHPFDKR